MGLPRPYYQEGGDDDPGRIALYHADCQPVLAELPACALLLTDPPYGIARIWQGGTWGAAHKHRETAVWDNQTLQRAVMDAINLAENAIVWGGNYYALPPSRCWFSWEKIDRMATLSDFELAWTSFDRPAKAWRGLRHTDNHIHPTQKPVALMLWCLKQARTHGLVLDPFVGSGTTLIAAKQMGLPAIGIEIEERYCEIAAKRLAQGVLEFKDP